MGLPTTTLDLSFRKGIQTKTDPKLQLDGELRRLENAVFDKVGVVNKRNGFDALSSIANTGSIDSGAALSAIGNELNLFSGTHLYGYSDSANSWISKGKAVSIVGTNYEIVQDNDQQTTPGVATALGVECHCREDSRGGIFYSLIDSNTRTIIFPDTQLNANGVTPRIFALNNYFICLYANTSNQIKYHTVSAANPTPGFSSATTFCSNLHGTNLSFDGVVTGNKLFIAYNSNAASIKVKSLDQNLALSSESNQASITGDSTIATFSDANQNLWVVAATSSVVKAFIRTYTGTSLLGNTTVETVNDVYRITGVVDGMTATIYYEINALHSYNQLIRSNTLTTAGVAGTAGVFKRSVGLAGKVFTVGENVYIPTAHQSTLQSTYFILDSSGTVVAKLLPGNAGGLAAKRVLPDLPHLTDTIVLFPNCVKGQAKSDSGIFYSLLGINLTKLDFDHPNKFQNAYLSNLLITGGVVSSFDGAGVVEHGFNLFPENATSVNSNTSDGYIANGSYQYKFVYQWIDNQGNNIRSAPSVALDVTTSGAEDTVTLTVPSLRLTEKSRVVVEAYRTEESGEVFFKATSTALPVYNDPTSDTVLIVDTLSDDQLTSNEPLYTTGEVENNAPGAASIITTWKQRAWLAGLEDPNQLQFSKKTSPGLPANFNATYTIDLIPTGGRIVDLAPLGDLLIIFKETAIYALSGEGPLNTGAQNDYQQPQLLSGDVGALRTGCVAQIPQGLIFVSQKGIYLIDHSGTCQYIGANVEAYNDLTFVTAITDPNTNRVAFLSSEGTWLIYDYFAQQWSTWTRLPAIDGVFCNGALVYLRENGKAYQQGESFNDAGQKIKFFLETSEYQPAGPQGYAILHKLTILGSYKSEHNLYVDLYRDYRSSKRSFVIDVEGTLNHSAYGDGYYGSGAYGGTTPRYQFSLKINQKASSFRVAISDDGAEESLSLSGLRIEAAILLGANRLPQKNTE